MSNSTALGLARARAVVENQAVNYHSFPPADNSRAFDAGFSGFAKTPLTDKIETKNFSRGSLGSFTEPITGFRSKVSKDEDLAAIEINREFLHSVMPVEGLPRAAFVFSHGMFIFNAVKILDVLGHEEEEMTASCTLLPLQAVNQLLRDGGHIERQIIARRLVAPEDFVRDQGASGFGVTRALYGGSMYDAYEPEPMAFTTPMKELASSRGGYAFSHAEFREKYRWLGMWHAEGQAIAAGESGYRYHSRADVHAEHFIRSPGADKVSTLTLGGRYMDGTPNIIGATARNLMHLSLNTKRANAPGLWDSLEGFEPEPIQLVPWASNRVARPYHMTSSKDAHKYRAYQGEQQLHPLQMQLLRYGGNKLGKGIHVGVDTVRAPGELSIADKSSMSPDYFEPYHDRCSRAAKYVYSEREKTTYAYTTLEEENSYYIGQIFDLSIVQHPTEEDIDLCMQDSTLDGLHLLTAKSKFQILIHPRPTV